jgi:two-component system cell cycle response regulator
MPDTTMARAYQVGERLRVSIASDAFPIGPGQGIHLTASVGLATLEGPDDTPETVFRRADSALFAAKRRGRNRVAANAA